MTTLKISMLGPRSVGKTSLLAAMYQKFNHCVDLGNLALTIDRETSAVLQERLIDLQNLVRGGEGVPATAGEMGVHALKRRNFVFQIGSKQRKAFLELRFQDYPGGYLSLNASDAQQKFVEEIAQESIALLIPIDATALMEANGQWCEMVNRPMEVTELLKRVMKRSDGPRLVVLAPTKCEKYMKDDLERIQLRDRVLEEYRDLIAFLGTPEMKQRVALVLTPVQTVGDVVYSRVDLKDRLPRFIFRPLPRAKYNPTDSEQPLRYLLSFLMKAQLAKRSWGGFDFVRDVFGMDDYLRSALSYFTAGCKTEDGFLILQGRHLLSLER
jgi:hypothetical protein